MTILLQVQAIVTRLQRARDMAPKSQFIQATTFRALSTAGGIEASIRSTEADIQQLVTRLAEVTAKIEKQALDESKE